MTIKTKLSLGLGFLFLIIFTLAVSGDLNLYFVWRFENVEIFF